MTKLIKTKTTTTVTEEIELSPVVPGKEISHRCMTVSGYGDYTGDDGRQHVKPKINLNTKWLADAGFVAGERIDVEVRENELVIRRLEVREA